MIPDDVEQKFEILTANIPPVTITLKDPMEGMVMVSAYLYSIGGGQKGAEAIAQMLTVACKEFGKEQGVEAWFNAVNAASKTKLPPFIKPLMNHYIAHMDSNYKKANTP